MIDGIIWGIPRIFYGSIVNRPSEVCAFLMYYDPLLYIMFQL
jgi:hypothetical protein